MDFGLTRLTVPRQRRVVRALKTLSEDKPFVKELHPDVRAALLAALAAGEGIDTSVEVPLVVLDTVTDSVLVSFETILEMMERLATDRVVRPSPEALERKADATALRNLAFPRGAQHITDLDMADQHKAMLDLTTTLTHDKTAVALVKRLGLEWAVAVLVAHLEPYGRAVRANDGRDVSADSAAFHTAFTDMALYAATHHRGDGELRRRLFAAYDSELEAQRDDERARKRARKKPAGEP